MQNFCNHYEKTKCEIWNMKDNTYWKQNRSTSAKINENSSKYNLELNQRLNGRLLYKQGFLTQWHFLSIYSVYYHFLTIFYDILCLASDLSIHRKNCSSDQTWFPTKDRSSSVNVKDHVLRGNSFYCTYSDSREKSFMWIGLCCAGYILGF